MPYRTTNRLPAPVKNNLPKRAQNIYLKAFNNAWKQYSAPRKRRGSATREETAHKVAWAAVKKEYKKQRDKWIRKK